MKHRPWRTGAACTVLVTGAVAALAAAPAFAKPAAVLYAAAGGGGGACTAKAPCSLSGALAAASSGATVHVRSGRYSGGYTISKKVNLVAQGRVVLDASSSADGTGIHIVGPGGSGSTVRGFVVEKAKFEGILVGTSPGDANPVPAPVTDVTLSHNWVLSNNAALGTPQGECTDHPPVPGDCGGGIHLVATSNSTVEDNVVAYNADGILLTDEFGPTAHNVVRDNKVVDNRFECGIVLAGHSGKAVDPQTGQLTGDAGVFDNLVVNNVARYNGFKSGSGILLGGGAPGSAVYGNVVGGNFVDHNGHAGITIHQHLVGDLNGNTIVNNTVGVNNTLGDDDFAVVDSQTTGIIVASGAPPGAKLPPFLLPSPISGTVITGNTISGDDVGIWAYNVPGDFSSNTFAADVKTHVSSN
jgi:parallel beta-helix repeat protein